MKLGRKKQSISISLDIISQNLNVSEFKYVGTTFIENERLVREDEIRCDKANQVIGQLSPILQHHAIGYPLRPKNILYKVYLFKLSAINVKHGHLYKITIVN
jgi:hypothetical protein